MLFNFIQILNSNSNASEQFLNRIFFSYQVNEKLRFNVNFANFQFNDRTLRLHFLRWWNQSKPSSWQHPRKPRTAHPGIINCHQSCQCCCRHSKAKILAPMEFLPWKKIRYVKMPKIAVKTPPISIKRLKLAHKRLKLAPTGENSTVISRIFHACIMVVHFFSNHFNPPQRTPRPS